MPTHPDGGGAGGRCRATKRAAGGRSEGDGGGWRHFRSSLGFVAQRMRANWRLLSVVGVGVLVASVLMASTTVYTRAISDLGLEFKLRQRLGDTGIVTSILPNAPVGGGAHGGGARLRDGQYGRPFRVSLGGAAADRDQPRLHRRVASVRAGVEPARGDVCLDRGARGPGEGRRGAATANAGGRARPRERHPARGCPDRGGVAGSAAGALRVVAGGDVHAARCVG